MKMIDSKKKKGQSNMTIELTKDDESPVTKKRRKDEMHSLKFISMGEYIKVI